MPLELKTGRRTQSNQTDHMAQVLVYTLLLGERPHGDWSAEEDTMIVEAISRLGCKWRAVAALLPGRTESGCRNRWVRNQERVFAAAGIHANSESGPSLAPDECRALCDGIASCIGYSWDDAVTSSSTSRCRQVARY